MTTERFRVIYEKDGDGFLFMLPSGEVGRARSREEITEAVKEWAGRRDSSSIIEIAIFEDDTEEDAP